jgi:hypothetical protein
MGATPPDSGELIVAVKHLGDPLLLVKVKVL